MLKTLKEFVYTNKIIPDIWKNKFNYQHDMTNLISKDKNLISYIGSFPLKSQLNQKLPKINSKTEINLMKNTYNKSKKSFRFKPKNDYGDDHAKLIMEEFEDYQFIITAHNKNWVDLLENICDESGRENIIYEIEDWSLEEGPVISQK